MTREEQLEKALKDIVVAAEPRVWETRGHPMNEWTRREPILRIAKQALEIEINIPCPYVTSGTDKKTPLHCVLSKGHEGDHIYG
jgi:hypothetical protein